MKTPIHYLLHGTLLSLAGLATASFADTIVMPNKTTLTRPIVKLSDTGVILDKNQMVNWTNTASLVFDRPPLQSPGQRLLLRDGTAFCGILARTTRDAITFRSITAGEITVAWSNVTAIRYGQSNRFPGNIEIKTGEIVLVLNDEERVQGALVGATEQHILMRTPEGMQKIATDRIIWLVVHPSIYASKNLVILLRNGDRLNGPANWKDNDFSVTLNDRMLNMEQAAIRAIINPGAH